MNRPTSWVITRKSTGDVIGEFFDPRNVARFNPETCIIETAHQYLGRINAEIKARAAIAKAAGSEG